MKLYYFNPNDYGIEWFVASDSIKNAIKALNEHLRKEFKNNPLNKPEDGDEPLQWGDPYFQGYTIDVYEPNQVIKSEIA